MKYETDVSGKWVPIEEAERLCDKIKELKEKLDRLKRFEIYYHNMMDKYED
jgi:hypothetical protein